MAKRRLPWPAGESGLGASDILIVESPILIEQWMMFAAGPLSDMPAWTVRLRGARSGRTRWLPGNCPGKEM